MRIAHLQLVEDRQENLDDCKSCDWGEEENSQELSSLTKKNYDSFEATIWQRNKLASLEDALQTLVTDSVT